MDKAGWTQAVLECTQALYRTYHALDASDYEAVAAGFAEDGEWLRQGKLLKGRGAIVEALRARPANRVTVHLIQNPVVDLEGEGEARLVYLLTAYRHDAPSPLSGPAPLDRPLSIALQEERMVRTGGRWLVVRRSSRQVFA